MSLSQSDLQRCLDRALSALLARRNPAGYWEGKLASSPLATAVALCALDENDIPAEKRRSACDYLNKTQNPDGGWGDTEISKSNLAATLLVLCANEVSKQPAIRNPQSAMAYVDKLGGLHEGLRHIYGKDLTFQVPIRMTAAYSGLQSFRWKDVDALPFELALAPRSLMGALRLPVVSYALPALVSVGLSRHAKAPSWMLPLRWLREAITNKALDAILKMQPESGGYLEAIPITAFCLIGLKSAGRADHPVAKNARRFLIDTQREDGSWPVEVNLSVWNTTRAIDALAAGGLLETALTEQERAATRDWILAQQTKTRSVYSDTQPGGWGWNHLPGSVPDVDDTSGAILALRSLGVTEDHPAIETGREWLLRLQNRNGGWPTFCRGWEKLPFDQSAPDLTAHALRALGPSRETLENPDFEEGLPQHLGWEYLANVQRSDGSFAPLWFGCETAVDEMNTTYGTTHVLFAEPLSKSKELALNWLRSIQNNDGGFGGCSKAESTAEETGLALRALLPTNGAECQRAAQWLIDHQRPDGSWNPAPIGFYFAVLWYYEELYPLVYAIGGLGALARVQQKTETAAAV